MHACVFTGKNDLTYAAVKDCVPQSDDQAVCVYVSAFISGWLLHLFCQHALYGLSGFN